MLKQPPDIRGACSVDRRRAAGIKRGMWRAELKASPVRGGFNVQSFMHCSQLLSELIGDPPSLFYWTWPDSRHTLKLRYSNVQNTRDGSVDEDSPLKIHSVGCYGPQDLRTVMMLH